MFNPISNLIEFDSDSLIIHSLSLSAKSLFVAKSLVFPKLMASEPDVSEISSLLESIERSRDLSLSLPFLLGLTDSSSRRDSENSDQENENRASPRDSIVLINPFTQIMMVIEGVSSLDTLFSELGTKNGQPPASKASIEAMPCFKIAENGVECVICLEEFEVGGISKEMPCKHKFHGNCIEKWLGIHGSCPVCRYKMPVDEEKLGKKRDEEGRDRRSEREIWVSYSVNSGRRNEDQNQNEVLSNDAAANDSSSPSSPIADTPDLEMQS